MVALSTFRLTVIVAVLTVALGVGAVLGLSASAQEEADLPAGDVSADLVTVHETELLTDIEVLDLEIGRARGEVAADLEAVDEDGDVEAHALANNLEASLLGELNLEEQLVHAEQQSPPDQDSADTDSLEDVSVPPVLKADMATATARALTGGGSGCLEESYTDSSADLAGAEVLPDFNDGEPLLTLTGGGENDAVFSRGTIGLVEDPDLAGDAVRSVATADLAAVEIEGYQIAVISQPRLSVTSPGPPEDGEGFDDEQAAMDADALEWTAPVLRITDPDGNEVATLDAADGNTEFTIPGVATISLGHVEFSEDDGTPLDGSNGTLAAEGEFFRIDVDDDVLGSLVHTDVAIAPLTASATTPADGVDCPPLDGVSKDVSDDPVSPGDTFTYTITIPNEAPRCTLTDVTVVDEIGGVDGLEITRTDPEADEVDGTTVTWNDVGPIAPGEEVTLEIDVAVPDDAEEGTITESLAINALCDDEPTDFEDDFDGPDIEVPVEPGQEEPPAEDPLAEVDKDVSQDSVQAGDEFTYTITIPNTGDCTLTDVTVVDEITGPAGSEITATRPPADDIDDLTVTWDDVGPIDPGEEVTLEVDVAVPDELTDDVDYAETLTITADCDGQTVDREIEHDGPRVIDRVEGPTRIETGIEVSEDAFETATAAVLARSDKFPDALTASSLAAEIPGPILVNPPDALRGDVGDELERLEVEQVYLAGGTAALSEQVEQDVQDRGIDTVRLDGNTRYHTAELIAREVADLGGPVDSVVLARDDLFPDSLSAGNLATWGRAPILLTPRDYLHGNSEETMTDSSVVADRGAFVVGGTAAVGADAVADARDAGFGVERLAGPERYATSVAISERVVDATDATLDPLYLATGRDFSDALVAAPAAFFTGGSLTLVDGVDLDISHATRDFLAERRDDVGEVTIVGGTAAISQSVVDQIMAVLEGD